MKQQNFIAKLSRREALYGLGTGIGSLAFSSMLQAENIHSIGPHHPAKAKRCIFLMMEGGPSHIDTFDPKPELDKRHLQRFKRSGERESAMSSGQRYFVKSPFDFLKAGKCGADFSSEWHHLKNYADDMCFYRGGQVESVNHPTACYHINTGNRFGGDPAVGSWVNYGLGTLNDNLPGFVVLPRASYPQGGANNWSNGFLPADYQGTPLRPEGSPILDLNLPTGMTRKDQRSNLDLLAKLNSRHLKDRSEQDELNARMSSYELAYRMQISVPEVMDISRESQPTLEQYGAQPGKASFANNCLLARRLVEQGVRFVQLFDWGWDFHGTTSGNDLVKRLPVKCAENDKSVTALLLDLKQRGLLDETLVVWGGEFGRTAMNEERNGSKFLGRDHHPHAYTI